MRCRWSYSGKGSDKIDMAKRPEAVLANSLDLATPGQGVTAESLSAGALRIEEGNSPKGSSYWLLLQWVDADPEYIRYATYCSGGL
jgi:hypothetical protein